MIPVLTDEEKPVKKVFVIPVLADEEKPVKKIFMIPVLGDEEKIQKSESWTFTAGSVVRG